MKLFNEMIRGGSDISWTICKSFAPHCRQITRTPRSHHSIFTADGTVRLRIKFVTSRQSNCIQVMKFEQIRIVSQQLSRAYTQVGTWNPAEMVIYGSVARRWQVVSEMVEQNVRSVFTRRWFQLHGGALTHSRPHACAVLQTCSIHACLKRHASRRQWRVLRIHMRFVYNIDRSVPRGCNSPIHATHPLSCYINRPIIWPTLSIYGSPGPIHWRGVYVYCWNSKLIFAPDKESADVYAVSWINRVAWERTAALWRRLPYL